MKKTDLTYIRPIFRCLMLLLAMLMVSMNMPAEDMPKDYVVDRAGIIDKGTSQKLNAQLQELEQKTGAQIIILVIPSTEGVPIGDYTIKKAEEWKLGQKGKDNGLLMVVAVNDRKYRIEVGYGLESIIPDSLAGSIGRQYLVPKFKAGNYSGGIYDTAAAIIYTIAKANNVQIEGVKVKNAGRYSSMDKLQGVGLFFIISIISLLFSFRSSRSGRYSHRPGGGVFWGGTGAGLGGFGGGGFGSFGGGGGGGFGGGGSSGSW